MVRRGKTNRFLRLTLGALREPIPVETWSRRTWGLHAARVKRWKTALQRQMQGKARREARSQISEAVAKRERAFQQGNMRRLLDSVLKRRRGGASLMTVEDAAGVVHASPEGATRAARVYFQNLFEGSTAPAWYEQEGVGEAGGGWGGGGLA